MGGAVQLGPEDGGQPDGAGAHHGDYVPRLDLTVAHANLVAGREDVGQHQDLLVARPDGARVGGRVGERNSDQLGLCAVDRVAEDPAAAAEALPVGALAAVPAAAAGGDAGHEDAVADSDALHAGPDGLDGADGFMAEDAAVDDGGNVALEDVEVGAADGGRVTRTTASVSSTRTASGTSSQAF